MKKVNVLREEFSLLSHKSDEEMLRWLQATQYRFNCPRISKQIAQLGKETAKTMLYLQERAIIQAEPMVERGSV